MEEVLNFNSIPEGYEIAFPRKETPAERRARLIEQFAVSLASVPVPNTTAGILGSATNLADAVIAATTEEK